MIPAEGGGKERENRGNSLRMELSKRSPALPWPRMAPVHANERILLALSASKPTSNHVLSWALQNVVQNVDETVLLLLLIPPQGRPETEVKRPWGFPVFVRDCGRGAQQIMEEDERLIMKRLRNLCDGLKVKAGIKIILRTESANDAIAKEAKKLGATWVILDRNLKKGVGKYCLEHLQCNVALVNHSKAKILHLNLKGSTLPLHAPQSTAELLMKKSTESESESRSSSSESGTPFTKTEHGTSSTAYNSSDPGMSPELPKASTNFVAANKHICYGLISATPDSGIRECHAEVKGSLHMDSDSDVGSVEAIFDNEETTDFASPALHPLPNRSDKVCRSSVKHGLTPEDTECSARDLSKISSKYKPLSVIANPFSMSSQDTQWDPDFPLYTDVHGWTRMPKGCSGKNAGANQHGRKLRSMENLVEGTTMTTMTEKGHLLKLEEWEEGSVNRNCKGTMLKPERLERASSLRKSISLVSKKMPPVPPPLCSLCQHKAPVFGKPPRRFCYTELEVATGGFSEPNFLAEGSFGSVHRGVLSDGQAIAVKQHKLASSQGDVEFCAEVEVLSCAQHRNVVMLIGYCVEEKRRLLVYEFICNGSLDSHLSGKRRPPLEWSSRQKIALGAARGLRYLHEECRVGCIVHRDVRPNNILLTHDFEPMVGDFGLARWQPDGDLGVETRVIGTFGYLAPEYAQSGEVTEKADVYSFGVVLLELVSGRKAIDINRPKGQQCLTEWAWRLLNQDAIQELIDPSLEGWYSDYEVYCMLHAAMLCICKDSHLRPRMSQVLRILEGDIILDRSGAFSPFFASSNTLNNPDQYRNGYARSFIEYDQSRSSQSINHNASLASEYLLMEKLSILCHSHSNWQ